MKQASSPLRVCSESSLIASHHTSDHYPQVIGTQRLATSQGDRLTPFGTDSELAADILWRIMAHIFQVTQLAGPPAILQQLRRVAPLAVLRVKGNLVVSLFRLGPAFGAELIPDHVVSANQGFEAEAIPGPLGPVDACSSIGLSSPHSHHRAGSPAAQAMQL